MKSPVRVVEDPPLLLIHELRAADLDVPSVPVTKRHYGHNVVGDHPVQHPAILPPTDTDDVSRLAAVRVAPKPCWNASASQVAALLDEEHERVNHPVEQMPHRHGLLPSGVQVVEALELFPVPRVGSHCRSASRVLRDRDREGLDLHRQPTRLDQLPHDEGG